jgi:hypothetical protein
MMSNLGRERGGSYILLIPPKRRTVTHRGLLHPCCIREYEVETINCLGTKLALPS